MKITTGLNSLVGACLLNLPTFRLGIGNEVLGMRVVALTPSLIIIGTEPFCSREFQC